MLISGKEVLYYNDVHVTLHVYVGGKAVNQELKKVA
jgi:hypothetical protein